MQDTEKLEEGEILPPVLDRKSIPPSRPTILVLGTFRAKMWNTEIPQASVCNYGGVEPYFPGSNYDILRMDVLHVSMLFPLHLWSSSPNVFCFAVYGSQTEPQQILQVISRCKLASDSDADSPL